MTQSAAGTKTAPTMQARLRAALHDADPLWAGTAVLAAICLVISFFVPLWKMKLKAPQYPNGLSLTAYGNRMEGDLKEINSLNHYVGVRAIEPDSVRELDLFPIALFLIVAFVLVAAVVRHWRGIPLRWVVIALLWAMPIGFLVDLQWWLYDYGHNLAPTAPIRIDEFTPKVLGTTKVVNFHSETMVSWGFWLMVVAALLVTAAPETVRFFRNAWSNTGTERVQGVPAVVVFLAPLALAAGAVSPGPGPTAGPAGVIGDGAITQAIAEASPGDTVVIPAGTYREQVVIDKSITLVGDGRPVIDGDELSDVVIVEADGVTLRGFIIQNSGLHVSEEPTGIRLKGDSAIVEDNHLRDVLYGITMQDGVGHTIRGNTVSSLVDRPTQLRGHALYLWNTRDNVIEDNVIDYAKDGIFLGFSYFNSVTGNTVTNVRYGIHYMYADDNTFSENTFTHNIAGAAIMYSRRITLSHNEFAYNTSEASGYGILLKDVDDVTIRDNEIHHNRLGFTMESAPPEPGRFVLIEDNFIGFNKTAIEMATTSDSMFTGNSFIGNLQQVVSRGGDISGKNEWAVDGRGNYWDDYEGYDANGDGIGDLEYRYEGAFDDLTLENEALKAYKFTFAEAALDTTAKWFPIYRPEPRVVDPAPLISPAVTLRAGAQIANQVQTALLGLVLVGLPVAVAWYSRRSLMLAV